MATIKLTLDELYEQYTSLIRQEEAVKAKIKTLRKQGERAAYKARHEAIGMLQDSILAIRAAWVPFDEQIAALEEQKMVLRAQSDALWHKYEQGDY